MDATPTLTTRPTFATLLRTYRTRAGLTQEALAERAGLSVRGISDLERGLKQRPRRDTLRLLVEGMGLAPAEQVALEAAARGPVPDASSARGVPFQPLPTSQTPLIGREREITAVIDRLARDDVRLLTLTGPGGVGKTRLVISVAAAVGSTVADGVCFVPLAPVRSPDLVLPAIARAVGAGEGPDMSLVDRIVAGLHPRSMVLVLDNFEHVLEAAPVVTTLLRACPKLMVLVTSRAALRVSGEHVYSVAPLALPDPDQLEAEATRLFVTCARAVRTDLDLTEETGMAIAAICRRLDGLPLAIELAAARVAVMSPQALSVRLHHALPLLTAGLRDQPARMRTMRATIAWSYDLLAPEMQVFFQRLAVFVGGFTLDGAERLADDNNVIDIVASLVEQSLIQLVMGSGSDPRYSMLETVREFGLERLADSGEEVTVRRAHAAYFVELAEALQPRKFGADSVAVLAQFETEYANLVAALDWTLDAGEGIVALRLAAATCDFWLHAGRLAEGQAWLDRALATGTAAPVAVRVSASVGASHIARLLGNYQQAALRAQDGIDLARASQDRGMEAMAMYAAGVVAHDEADFSTAASLYEDACRLARDVGNGFMAALAGADRGAVARGQGEYDRAEAWLNVALAGFRQLDSPWGIAVALRELGHVYGARGEHARAGAAWRESLAIHWAERDPWSVTWCLEGLAELAAHTSHGRRAARLYGAAERLREQIGAPLPQDDRQRNARAWDTVRAALGEATFAEAWTSGRAMSLAEAVAEAEADGDHPTTRPKLAEEDRASQP